MVFHQPSGQLKAMFSVIVIIIIITIAISNHLCVCCIMRIKFIVWKAIQLFLCHFITPLIVSFQISAKEDIFISLAIILHIQYIIHRISFKIQIHPNGRFHPCVINIILREELKHFSAYFFLQIKWIHGMYQNFVLPFIMIISRMNIYTQIK